MLSRLVNSTLEKLSIKEVTLSSPDNLYPTLSFPPPYPEGTGSRSICARCLTLLSHMITHYGDGTQYEGLQIVHSSSMQTSNSRPKHSRIWKTPPDDILRENSSDNEPACVICVKTRVLVDAMQAHISFEPSLRKAPYKDWSLTWTININDPRRFSQYGFPHDFLSILITARHNGGYSWGIGGFKIYPSAKINTIQNLDSRKHSGGDYPIIVSLDPDPEDHKMQNTNTSNPELDFSSTLSAGTLNEIATWAKKCATSHSKCRRIFGRDGEDQFEPEAEWFPDRLINLTCKDDIEAGSTKVTARVVVKSDPADFPPETKGVSYLSLSHSWGPAPNPSAPLGGRADTVLTKSNLARWRVDLPLDDLPLTFRQAVIVCAYLGFQYIWIDSLCILQDSVEDWKAQSAVMGDVYKYAWLNIAALSTASDYDGFINESRDPRLEFGFRIPFASIFGLGDKTHNANGQDCVLLRGTAKFLWNFCGDIPGSTASNAPLFTRAWVYQERNLARRTLAFAKSTVYWACDEETHGEQPEWGGIEGSGLRKTLHSAQETAASRQISGLSWTSEQSWGILRAFEQRWQSTVTSYTLCNLTKHTDKLIAVSSIARELGNMMPKRYLAGLWDVALLYQLTWINVNGYATPSRKQVGDTDYVAPSWSWASIEAPVQKYCIVPSIDKQRALADVLAADVALETDFSFGFVKAGWLRIRGRLNRVKSRPRWTSSGKSVSLTDEATGQDLWFTGDTVEGYELIKSRKGLERLVWIPLLASFDSAVSCQCLYLIEVNGRDQIGDDGKFVKPGEKVYRRVGSGNFGRVTTKLQADKLILGLGTYAEIPAEAGQLEGQVIASGFRRNEDGFREFVLI